MFRATMTKMSIPYGIFLIKVFKYFKTELNNEKTRTPKPISDEYNEKTLKRTEYFLKYNKWTPKPSKKTGEESVSKEKAPSRSRSVKKTLTHEFKGTEMEMSGFMVQVIELCKI